jgi:hypothetical protein
MPFATILVFISIFDGNTGGIFVPPDIGIHCLRLYCRLPRYRRKASSEACFAAGGLSL